MWLCLQFILSEMENQEKSTAPVRPCWGKHTGTVTHTYIILKQHESLASGSGGGNFQSRLHPQTKRTSDGTHWRPLKLSEPAKESGLTAQTADAVLQAGAASTAQGHPCLRLAAPKWRQALSTLNIEKHITIFQSLQAVRAPSQQELQTVACSLKNKFLFARKFTSEGELFSRWSLTDVLLSCLELWFHPSRWK